MPVNSAACYDPLLAYARDPHDLVTRAFVSAIEMARSSSRLSGRTAFGLDANEFEALLNRYFPGAASVYLTPALKASLRWRASASGPMNLTISWRYLDHCPPTAPRAVICLRHAACCMGTTILHMARPTGRPCLISWHAIFNLFSRNTAACAGTVFYK